MKHSITFLALSFCLPIFGADQEIARWPLDALDAGPKGAVMVRDVASGTADRLSGNGWLVAGVQGRALQFDGITAYIVRKAANAPRLSGAFTLEAWFAVGAYPFNWCPIFQQQDEETAGFFFGIGDKGQLRFSLAAGDRWQSVETKPVTGLRAWVHAVAVYDSAGGMAIYVNGLKEASGLVAGAFRPATISDLWIGRNSMPLEQTSPVSAGRQFPTKIMFDGILDELAMRAGARTGEQLAAEYRRHQPLPASPLPPRVLPAGPPGPGRFGALYSRLQYYKGWDDYWRTGDDPDVVVRFDQAPFRFVFWRGTSYIPHWVTENGIWYDNEFTESFQKGLQGSAEPMSDKQCRYSHVRVLESNDARVVVHWRYSPIDVNYAEAFVDPSTSWGDWTDEIYTIYPDGVGVRQITVHSSGPMDSREWHEGIVVMGPGMSPNDVLEPEGLTLVSPSGKAHTYSWRDQPPGKQLPDSKGSTIQIVNTKSRYRPFAAAREADRPAFTAYHGEIRREVSMYPWWNHWPTAFEPSNGRYALAADRASHSSLTHMKWREYATGPGWASKVMLHGLSQGSPAEIAATVRSWDHAPLLRLEGTGFAGGSYDPAERAYVLSRQTDTAPLEFTLAASVEAPARNFALIIRNWGDDGAQLKLNGRPVPRGAAFRCGSRQTIEGSDMIIWVETESNGPLHVTLTKGGKPDE